MTDDQKAQEQLVLGNNRLDAGELEAAMEHFQKARELAPRWAVPAYNVGLVAKFEHDWPLSLQANWDAFHLDPQDQAAQWNLSIAACAVGDWQKAGVGFRAIGMTLPDGPGPWDLKLGLTPVRLQPDGDPEVVWGHRLDPCRVRIQNVPTLERGYRYRDIVLIDGAPEGKRLWQGREYSVHNVLELLEASEFVTHVLALKIDNQNALANLEAMLSEHGAFMEDWTSGLQLLCRACSEGTPHKLHDHELPETEWQPARRIALALPPTMTLETAREFLSRQGRLLD